MIAWGIVIAYIAAVLWFAHRFAVAELERAAKRSLSFTYRRKDEPLVDGEDRALALVGGVLLGLLWPLALPALLWSRALSSPTIKAEAQQRELEQLRALAREHGLPLPDDHEKRA